MTIDQVCLYQYQLPLRYPLPLKGTQLSMRKGFILELKSEGRYGYGEAAPLADFSQESLSDAQSQLVKLSERLVRGDETPGHSLFPSVQFALESALWSLNQTQWLSPPKQAPLLQGDTDDIVHRLQKWQGAWPAEFKLKIGRGTLSEDIERIYQVLQQLPESVRLRLDANQRWSYQQAIEVCGVLDSQRIAYIEEPTANPAEFSDIYRATGVAFALDETVQHIDYQFQTMEGLAALVIKPTLVGGLARCQQLIKVAQSEGTRVVLSSAFESSVGIHILQQLSAHWLPDEWPGLDTKTAFHYPLTNSHIQPCQRLQLRADFISWEYSAHTRLS